MASQTQLENLEELVRFNAQIPATENPHFALYISELGETWENRAVLRHLRLLAGGTCWTAS